MTIYRDKFQCEGYEAELTGDGNSAMGRLKGSPPDVVLLDLMLPEVNGVEVLKFIRAQEITRALPVIVFTNAYAGGLVQAAREAGANRCLSKAMCTPAQLVDEVAGALAGIATPPAASQHPPATARVPEPASVPAASAPIAAGSEQSLSTLRRDTLVHLPEQLEELRQLLQQVIKCDPFKRLLRLLELYRGVHSLTGRAGVAGLALVARMSSALEALLNELKTKPEKVNPSTLRTLAQGVDVLAALAEKASAPQDELIASPLILVLDDESISRETVCVALEKAHLRAVALDDSASALKLLEENRFDLVFLDADMPGLNGLEVCKRLYAMPSNKTTPVVFVTGLTDFETQAQSALSGGTDLIAKPIVLIELAVKALIHLLRGRLAAASAHAAHHSHGQQTAQRGARPLPFSSSSAQHPTRTAAR